MTMTLLMTSSFGKLLALLSLSLVLLLSQLNFYQDHIIHNGLSVLGLLGSRACITLLVLCS